MSDLDVVALSLTTEFMCIYSENLLFKQLNQYEISNLIELNQFKKKKKIVLILR